jgi:hypothetical protein
VRPDLSLTRRQGFVVFGVALGLGALAALVMAFRPKGRRVALVGDSLAVGLTGPLGKLVAAAGVPFKAEGHVGSTVAQWLATPSWGSWVSSFSPTVTLVVLGTNDYLNPLPDLAAYRQLAAKFPGAVWVAPPDEPKAPMPQVRATIDAIGVPVIPEATGLQYGADGIHPSNYAPWAQFIWSRFP